MRVVGFVTRPHVIDRILTHLRRHLGVSRSRPRLWILGSGGFGLRPGWLEGLLGPDPDPGRAGGGPVGPRSRPPAAARPPRSLAAASRDGSFTQP